MATKTKVTAKAAPKAATKLTPELKKKLERLGVTTTSEEAARDEMIEFLKSQDLDGLETEDTNSLLEMYETFQTTDEAADTTPADEPEDDEDTPEDAPEPEEEPEEEPVEEPADDEDTPEEEGSAYTKDELDAMELADLKQICDGWELEHPKIKTKVNYVKLILAQYEVAEEPVEEVVVEAKPEKGKKASTKPADVKSEKFNTANKAHAKLFKPLEDHISAFVAKAYPTLGVRVKYLGRGLSVYLELPNSEKIIISMTNCRLWNNEPNGYLDLNAYKGEEEVNASGIVDPTGKGFKHFSKNLLFIQGIYVSQCVKVLTPKILKDMVEKLVAIDKKLGKNREKLEEKMKEASKPAAKVAPKAPAKVAAPAPTAKVAPKPVAKPAPAPAPAKKVVAAPAKKVVIKKK